MAGILRALGYRSPLAQPWLRLAATAITIVLALALGAGTFAAARAIITIVRPTPRITPTATPLAATPFSLDGPIEQIAPEGWVVLEHARRIAAPDGVGRLARARDLRSGDSALAIYTCPH